MFGFVFSVHFRYHFWHTIKDRHASKIMNISFASFDNHNSMPLFITPYFYEAKIHIRSKCSLKLISVALIHNTSEKPEQWSRYLL